MVNTNKCETGEKFLYDISQTTSPNLNVILSQRTKYFRN